MSEHFAKLWDSNMRLLQDERDEQAASLLRERDVAYRSAVAGVCAAMSASAMAGALTIPDPRLAADSFGDAMRWQIAEAISAVAPEAALKFIKESKQ
jgi:hypothetical protein